MQTAASPTRGRRPTGVTPATRRVVAWVSAVTGAVVLQVAVLTVTIRAVEADLTQGAGGFGRDEVAGLLTGSALLALATWLFSTSRPHCPGCRCR